MGLQKNNTSRIYQKKIFITYGNEQFYPTLKRIGKEAKSIKIFDKIILYTPKDLPEYILSSPLMAHYGGCWCWKPWIIWKTMQDFPNDIIVYADAGSTLQQSQDWDYWFSLMKTTNMLVTAYRSEYDYGWKKDFGEMRINIGSWTKLETRQFFDSLYNGLEWRQYNKLWAGFIIVKHDDIIVRQWLDIMLYHPELVADPLNIEIQPDDYICHRHDQTILTIIAYKYRNDESIIKIIPETSESTLSAGVLATRIRKFSKPTIIFKLKHSVKKMLKKFYKQIFSVIL